MERPVSPDAPKMITFMLAMQRMLRVVLVSWENSDLVLRQCGGYSFVHLFDAHRGTLGVRSG